MEKSIVFEVKKPHGPCRVITAKPPGCMIDVIDKFREESYFNTRNDAIIFLLAYGMHDQNLIGEAELNQYLELYSPSSVEGDGAQ